MIQALPMTLELCAQPRVDPAEAFADLVRDHQGMVFSIALRFLGNRALAEEVAQEAFFRLHSRLETLESPEHRVRWLRKVTARLCIDELRRRPPLACEDPDELPGADGGPGDPLAAGHLRRLLASLAPTARMAIILRYQEEMEPGEIATLLNEPVNTIKSRLQRALASLRDGFDRLAEGRCP